MKLFLLATLSLFVSSGAVDVQRQSTGLRSIGVEAFSDVNTLTAVDEVYISTMLEVHGGDWKHVHDDDHVPAMTKCLLASYNKQDMMGFEMKSVNPKKEIDIPEDGDDEADNEMLQKNYYRSMAYLLGLPKYGRPRRSNEAALSHANFISMLTSPSMATLHAEFEANVCKCLEKSGVAFFKDAKDCSVNYLSGPTAIPPVVTTMI